MCTYINMCVCIYAIFMYTFRYVYKQTYKSMHKGRHVYITYIHAHIIYIGIHMFTDIHGHTLLYICP